MPVAWPIWPVFAHCCMHRKCLSPLQTFANRTWCTGTHELTDAQQTSLCVHHHLLSRAPSCPKHTASSCHVLITNSTNSITFRSFMTMAQHGACISTAVLGVRVCYPKLYDFRLRGNHLPKVAPCFGSEQSDCAHQLKEPGGRACSAPGLECHPMTQRPVLGQVSINILLCLPIPAQPAPFQCMKLTLVQNNLYLT